MNRLTVTATAAVFGLAFLAPLAAPAADKTTLVVLAASSSKSAIADAAEAFQKKHPDVSVAPSFAGSKVIAAQIQQGAAADVVVMSDGVAKELGASLEGVTPVMRNHTTIIVTKSAAGKIHGPADLVAKGIRLGGGTPGSAIANFDEATIAKLSKDFGADYAAKFAANIQTTKTDNAKLSAAVGDDLVDAAILFPSDAVAGKSVEVPLPEKDRYEETHSVGVVKASKNGALAREFAAFLTSSEGAAIFRARHHDPVH